MKLTSQPNMSGPQVLAAVILFAAAGLVLLQNVKQGNAEQVDDVVQEALTSDDPFRCHAAETLAGEHGVQPQWKLNAYRNALLADVHVQGLAKCTLYCPWCAGKTCADGTPVQLGVCAANPEIPMGSYVWVRGSLYKVCDRGGAVTLAYTRRGETAVLDLWVPRCPGPAHWSQHKRCWQGSGTMRLTPFAVVQLPGEG